MIYGSFVRSKEEIEQAVNRAQRKYDFKVEAEDNGRYRITLDDGLHTSDVVVSPDEVVADEVNRLVDDFEDQKYDTED